MKWFILPFILFLACWLSGCGKSTPLPVSADLASTSTNSPLPSTAAPDAKPKAETPAAATANFAPVNFTTATLAPVNLEPLPTPNSFPAPGAFISWSGPLAWHGWQLTLDYDGILLYDLATLTQQRFTSWDGATYPPRWAWSTDGDRILFENQIVNLSTGETLALSTPLAGNPSAEGGLLRWHPQGKIILVGGLLVRADSGALIKQISENAPYRGGWSQDGKKLALVNWDNFLSLWDVNVNEAGQVTGFKITHDSCGVQAGSRLVCLGAEYHDESPNAQILAVEETLSRIENVQWAPTSDRLIFSTERELYLYNPETDQLAYLTNGFLESNDRRFIGGQNWSPDGQKVTFSLLPSGGGYPQVYMVTISGEIIEITGDEYPYGAFPIWSPDGQWIFYSSSSPESGGQVIARTVTGSEWISLPSEIVGFALEFRPGAGIGGAPVGNASAFSPCSPTWSRLAIGQFAAVTDENAAANRVRSEPVIADNVISMLGPGTVSKILEGPVCVDEYVFWKVENSTIPGGVGWTSEGDGKSYWLAPYGSAAAAASPTTTFTPRPTITLTPRPTATPTPRLTPTPTSRAASSWTKLSVNAPTPWRGMAAVYDVKRSVTVLFGGTGETGKVLNETWEFDGLSWKKITTMHSPPARFWHGMAYDTARGKVVLYGGWQSDNGGALNDTWEYDGIDWTNIQSNNPGGRGYGFGMTYDSCRKKVVLFGGTSSFGQYLNDTWEYDGVSWKQIATSSTPSERGLTSLAFDSARCVAVLFGGIKDGIGYNDTWEFNGVNWSKAPLNPAPLLRWAHALVYNPLAKQMLLFGGYTPGTNMQVNDTWVYAGQTWAKLQPPQSPSGREQHVLVFDGRGVLLYGGYGFKETWQYNW